MTLPTRLGYARTLALRWLTDSCTLHEPGAVVPISSGGTTVEPGTDHLNVACRLARKDTRAVLSTFGEQLVSGADWVLYAAPATLLREGWTVTVAGDTYAVIALAADATGAAYTQALLRGQTPVPNEEA